MNAARRPDATRLLGIEHPIVQGPFGGGLSSVPLAVAVSQRGGLGSFGAHMLAPERIGPLVDELRARAQRPFAINLWVSDHDPGGLDLDDATLEAAWPLFKPWFDELGVDRPERLERAHPPFAQQVEALLDARPPVFSFVFGIPPAAVLDACRQRGIVTVGTATTVAEALALDDAGVDLVVATGAEAGGHRPSFLDSAEASLTGTLALVPQVVDAIRAPVVAAGGIADGRGIRAVLALGAQAAQIGTAFLACSESGTTDLHRDALFSPSARRTVLTRAFTGRLARGIGNRWTDEMSAVAAQLPPFPITGWFVSKLRPAALAAGRTDLLSLWSGQVAPMLRHRDVASLMHSLLADLHGQPAVHHEETIA